MAALEYARDAHEVAEARVRAAAYADLVNLYPRYLRDGHDVVRRVRLRGHGLLNVMTPFAAGVHYESKSRGDDTKSGGEKQQRYEREKACFVHKYRELMEKGDPYYNPHLTLLYENYGWR